MYKYNTPVYRAESLHRKRDAAASLLFRYFIKFLSLQYHRNCVEGNKEVCAAHHKADWAEDILFNCKCLAFQCKECHWQYRQQIFALNAVDCAVAYRCPADAEVNHKAEDHNCDKAEHTSVTFAQGVAVAVFCKCGHNRTYKHNNYKRIADDNAVVAQHAPCHALDVVSTVFEDCCKDKFECNHRVLQHKADVEGCIRVCEQQCFQTFGRRN